MFFGDAPAKSASLRHEGIFQESDAKLEELGKDLMNSVSTGDLNKVALEAWDRFCKGTGGTYSNDKLTAEVRSNEKTTPFVRSFCDELQRAVVAAKGDLSSFTPLRIGRFAFDSITDNATGLGILIHDIWSIKAELKDFTATWDNVANTGAFYGTIVFTLTDDFGLDWADIEQHGTDHVPPTLGWYNTGDRFKAWYILQHYRSAKPFFIEVKLDYIFDDGAIRPF